VVPDPKKRERQHPSPGVVAGLAVLEQAQSKNECGAPS
jgi:hypothetical protein